MDIRMSTVPARSCGNSGYYRKGTVPSVGPQVTLDMTSYPPVLDTRMKLPPQKTNSSSSRGVCMFEGQWWASIRNMYNSIKSSGTPVTWVNPDLVPQFEPRCVPQLPQMGMPQPYPNTAIIESQNVPLWFQAPPGSQYHYQDPLHIYNPYSQSYPGEFTAAHKGGMKSSSQPLNPEAKEWVPSSFKNNKEMSSKPSCSVFPSNVQKPVVIATAVSVGFVEITEKEISEVRETMKSEIPKMSVENCSLGGTTADTEKSDSVCKSIDSNIQNAECNKFCSTESKLKCKASESEQVNDTHTYASIARKSPEPPQISNGVNDTNTSSCDMIKQPIPKIFMKDKKYPKEKAPPLMESKQRDLPFRTASRSQKRSSRKFLKDLKDHSPAKSDCSFSERGDSLDPNSDIVTRLSISCSPSYLTLSACVSPKDKSTFMYCSPRDGKPVRSSSDSNANDDHVRTTSESSTVSGESVEIEFNDDCVIDSSEREMKKHPNSILAHILGLDSDSEDSEDSSDDDDDDWDNVDSECTTVVLDDTWETFGLVFPSPVKSVPSSSLYCGKGYYSEVGLGKSDNICDNTFSEYCNSADNLKEINRHWESEIIKDIKPSSPCRVQFGRINVHPMVTWTFAYKNARRGPWEQYARDRVRFHSRIEALEPVISLVLEGSHREAMYQKICCS